MFSSGFSTFGFGLSNDSCHLLAIAQSNFSSSLAWGVPSRKALTFTKWTPNCLISLPLWKLEEASRLAWKALIRLIVALCYGRVSKSSLHPFTLIVHTLYVRLSLHKTLNSLVLLTFACLLPFHFPLLLPYYRICMVKAGQQMRESS